jgi:hypothetical protein
MNDAQNRLTNPVHFFDSSGNVVYAKPLEKSNLVYQKRNTLIGKGYLSRGKLVNEPFDFSTKNRFTLSDLHSVLQSVIFPEAVPAGKRFNLKEEDYRFLYRYMSMLPRESDHPQYDITHYPDGYVKFLMFGGSGPITNLGLRIFNKVGDAYGFLTDVAYIVDFENKIEFFLSATIYCNADGIFNDDKYEYDTLGFPFLKAIGELVYAYELKRTRKVLPDLSKFQLSYNNN